MANNVEFEMTIEKLTFKFKGDRQTAQGVQSNINDTLAALASTQSDVMGLEPDDGAMKVLPPGPAPVASAMPSRRRTTRRRTNSARAGVAKNELEDVPGQAGPKAARGRRSSDGTYTAQILKLHEQSFFAHKQSVSDTRTELEKRGFHYESRGISTALLSLTRKNILSREQNAEGNWIYENSPQS